MLSPATPTRRFGSRLREQSTAACFAGPKHAAAFSLSSPQAHCSLDKENSSVHDGAVKTERSPLVIRSVVSAPLHETSDPGRTAPRRVEPAPISVAQPLIELSTSCALASSLVAPQTAPSCGTSSSAYEKSEETQRCDSIAFSASQEKAANTAVSSDEPSANSDVTAALPGSCAVADKSAAITQPGPSSRRRTSRSRSIARRRLQAAREDAATAQSLVGAAVAVASQELRRALQAQQEAASGGGLPESKQQRSSAGSDEDLQRAARLLRIQQRNWSQSRSASAEDVLLEAGPAAAAEGCVKPARDWAARGGAQAGLCCTCMKPPPAFIAAVPKSEPASRLLMLPNSASHAPAAGVASIPLASPYDASDDAAEVAALLSGVFVPAALSTPATAVRETPPAACELHSATMQFVPAAPVPPQPPKAAAGVIKPQPEPEPGAEIDSLLATLGVLLPGAAKALRQPDASTHSLPHGDMGVYAALLRQGRGTGAFNAGSSFLAPYVHLPVAAPPAVPAASPASKPLLPSGGVRWTTQASGAEQAARCYSFAAQPEPERGRAVSSNSEACSADSCGAGAGGGDGDRDGLNDLLNEAPLHCDAAAAGRPWFERLHSRSRSRSRGDNPAGRTSRPGPQSRGLSSASLAAQAVRAATSRAFSVGALAAALNGHVDRMARGRSSRSGSRGPALPARTCCARSPAGRGAAAAPVQQRGRSLTRRAGGAPAAMVAAAPGAHRAARGAASHSHFHSRSRSAGLGQSQVAAVISVAAAARVFMHRRAGTATSAAASAHAPAGGPAPSLQLGWEWSAAAAGGLGRPIAVPACSGGALAATVSHAHSRGRSPVSSHGAAAVGFPGTAPSLPTRRMSSSAVRRTRTRTRSLSWRP